MWVMKGTGVRYENRVVVAKVRMRCTVGGQSKP